MEGAIGKMPQTMIEEELAEIINWHNSSTDLVNIEKVSDNGYKRYIKSRPAASSESIKRVKKLRIGEAGIIPEYSDVSPNTTNLLSKILNYRPQGTIFEIGAKTSSVNYQVMKRKRTLHKHSIVGFHKKEEEELEAQKKVEDQPKKINLPSSTTDEINAAFNTVVLPKKRNLNDLYKPSKKKKRTVKRDEDFFIPYSAADKHTEEGLAVNSFNTEADKVQMDLTGDNEESQRLQAQFKKWDRKKKKIVTIDNNRKVGKIQTESGVWIPASYKSNRYSAWKEKSKIDVSRDDSEEEEPDRSYKEMYVNIILIICNIRYSIF